MIMAFLMTQSFQNLFCQSLAALAALGPYLGQCKLTASGLAKIADQRIFCFCICNKGIQSNHYRNSVFLDILNMLLQIHNPFL